MGAVSGRRQYTYIDAGGNVRTTYMAGQVTETGAKTGGEIWWDRHALIKPTFVANVAYCDVENVFVAYSTEWITNRMCQKLYGYHMSRLNQMECNNDENVIYHKVPTWIKLDAAPKNGHTIVVVIVSPGGWEKNLIELSVDIVVVYVLFG